MRAAALIPALLAAAAAVSHAQSPVPELRARVTDLTGTLNSEQRAVLEQRLAGFERQKGSQVAVLIVPSTQPETIEQYAIRVAERWRLGRKGVDDGVLLVVAKNDRRVRIEVGYGLEGAIPDAVAKRIIAEIITPYFREDDFFGGISAGVEQLLKSIRGEPLPAPAQRSRGGGGSDPSGELLAIGFLIFFIGSLFSRRWGEVPASTLNGAAFGAVSGLVLEGLLVGLACGIAMFGVSLLLLAARGGSGGSDGFWGGGWSSHHGGFGGGGFGSGGFGGFGGGGGGFGGGGASGGW